MLFPYKNPLLVALISSQAAGIEEQLKETAFQILTKLYPPTNGSTLKLHILSAFVDKVVKVIPGSDISTGAHGYSFWWTSCDMLRTPSSIIPRQDRTQPQGSLTVDIDHLPPKPSTGLYSSSSFRIPLVNTTFITGRDYTMHLQSITWKGVTERNSGSWSFDSYHVGKVLHLDHENAILGIKSSRELGLPQTHPPIKVANLTPWRVAIDVSGNVIKSVMGSESPVPASTELERAIAGLASTEYGQFEVWAQIRNPQDEAAAEHTRYVRVIGGGGGWGEKRGLIALDPESFAEPLSTAQQDLSGELDLTKLLPNILEPGHEIRFLKYPIDQIDVGVEETSVPTPPQVYIQSQGQTSFGFGTTGTPELKESYVTAPQVHHDSDPGTLIEQTVFGHFGAMTQRMHHEYTYEPTTKTDTTQAGVQHRHATHLPPSTYISDGRQFIDISHKDR